LLTSTNFTEYQSGTNSPPAIKQRPSSDRWKVLIGGCLMDLAFGNIYGWSVFVAPLEKEFGWKRADTSMVFTIAVFMTGLTFLLSGWIYDKWGPSFCAFTGAILASLGFYLSAYTHSLAYLFFWFGVVGGFGAGLGCAVIIPTIAKWFPDKRGLAVGLIVGAYGASSAIFGPLAANVLIPVYGLNTTFQILGMTFLVMTITGAFFLKNPSPGFRPENWSPTPAQKATASICQFTPSETLRASSFQWIWLAYALGGSAGMMVISQLVPFAISRGISSNTLVTMALSVGALGNVLGRVLSGWMSDALGRLNVLRLMIAVSAITMPVLYAAGGNVWTLYAAVIIVYYCYGTLLSVNAALCPDFWGIKHVGLINGMIFTAWGTAGIIGPRIGGLLYDKYRDYRIAFYTASFLAVVALIFEFLAKQPPNDSEVQGVETACQER
jgi:OFA family oxalate/formate antiporter-like MFS transporter